MIKYANNLYHAPETVPGTGTGYLDSVLSYGPVPFDGWVASPSDMRRSVSTTIPGQEVTLELTNSVVPAVQGGNGVRLNLAGLYDKGKFGVDLKSVGFNLSVVNSQAVVSTSFMSTSYNGAAPVLTNILSINFQRDVVYYLEFIFEARPDGGADYRTVIDGVFTGEVVTIRPEDNDLVNTVLYLGMFNAGTDTLRYYRSSHRISGVYLLDAATDSTVDGYRLDKPIGPATIGYQHAVTPLPIEKLAARSPWQPGSLGSLDGDPRYAKDTESLTAITFNSTTESVGYVELSAPTAPVLGGQQVVAILPQVSAFNYGNNTSISVKYRSADGVVDRPFAYPATPTALPPQPPNTRSTPAGPPSLGYDPITRKTAIDPTLLSRTAMEIIV